MKYLYIILLIFLVGCVGPAPNRFHRMQQEGELANWMEATYDQTTMNWSRN